MELCGLSGEMQPDGELVEVEEDELEMRMGNRLRYGAGGICCTGSSFGGCNIKSVQGLWKVSLTGSDVSDSGAKSSGLLLMQISIGFHEQLEEEKIQPSPLHGAQQHLRLAVRPQKDSFPYRKCSFAILRGSVIPTVSNRGRPVVFLPQSHVGTLTRPRVKGNFV